MTQHLTADQERYFDDLDRRATDTGFDHHPVDHDSDSGARLLMRATGATNVDDAQEIALGRPSRESGRHGESPIVKFKVPAALKERMAAVAKSKGISVSEAWRNAGRLYTAR
ncbi:MAG: hypothetical protein J6575_04490 [Bifidobacterium sp.]|nr:hypothetical protein [Bifidobacterium sp.]